jgi:hypothetical protein
MDSSDVFSEDSVTITVHEIIYLIPVTEIRAKKQKMEANIVNEGSVTALCCKNGFIYLYFCSRSLLQIQKRKMPQLSTIEDQIWSFDGEDRHLDNCAKQQRQKFQPPKLLQD